MFDQLNINNSSYEIADFLEYECIKNGGQISSMSYRSLLSMPSDELVNEGIDSSDDHSVVILDEAIAECEDRKSGCPQQYPFTVGPGSLSLRADASWYTDIYVFMLLATRLNMKTNREHAGYDGTQLFELLCAQVTKEYFGNHCCAMVFGTASGNKFQEKVEGLIRSLRIQGLFKKPLGSTGRQKDGNLDIVAWIPFSDKKDGQMIALGQCKTGKNWEGLLTEMNPDVFFSCFCTQQPYSRPLKLFFVTESFGNYKWEERCTNGGILFDRTRIMEFLPEAIDASLLAKIKSWNKEALINCA